MIKIAYIAGPYSAPSLAEVQSNIDAAEAVGKEMLLLHDFAPVIPHRITGFWDNDSQFSHLHHGDWMHKVCLPLLGKCDVIVMCSGWQDSPGSVMEHQFATFHGKEIYYHGETI